ncbi:hypothetical protein D9613_007837 [Agrocybe pediades]|uniref:Uncharacterized protein n=1 Tax=Agrocybe pediades TaxID=84607 RepID=A0A8H4QNJ8_9AGAR|nr:hypothetical protein D9613_007837 [Agrocybe pediades]
MSKLNKPSLLIGHHLLEGKIATLPKPYAILMRKGNQKTAKKKKKKIHSDEEAAEGDDDMVDEEEEEAMQIDGESPDLPGSGSEPSVEATSAGWTIAGIVKKKIIFSKRPMPVIGKKP